MEKEDLEMCVEKVKVMKQTTVTDEVVTCRILCDGYNKSCKDYKPIGKAVSNSKKGIYNNRYFHP
jgi:hypothetical protein